LLTQLPALDDLSCDYPLWQRMSLLRPLCSLKRLTLHFAPLSGSSTSLRAALCVPQLSELQMLSLQNPFLPSPQWLDGADAGSRSFVEANYDAVFAHLKSLRELRVRVRQTSIFLSLLLFSPSHPQQPSLPLLEQLHFDVSDEAPSPTELQSLLLARPTLRLLSMHVQFPHADPPRFFQGMYNEIQQSSDVGGRLRIEY